MPYGMYISAEGADIQSHRMDVIANNMANVDTVGFKRDEATFQARFAEAIEQGLEEEGTGTIDDIGGGVELLSVTTDHSAGPMKLTKIPTDVAIGGEGFFQVQREDGVFLTRAGNFTIDAETGALVTPEDLAPVLSEDGAPLVLNPSQGRIKIDHRGAVTQEDPATGQYAQVGKLGLVQPASLGDLVKEGDNLFRPLAETQPVEEDRRMVRQGYLEMSSVDPTREMVSLIETSRAFEANMKMIQNQDELISSLVQHMMLS